MPSPLPRRGDACIPSGCITSLAALSKELTALKQVEETAWLKGVDSQALQQALSDLAKAFEGFFSGTKGYPRLAA